MSVIWNGRLLNDPTNIVIDSIALLFTICAYIPQILELHRASTGRGISTYFLLFNVLFSNAQLSQALIWAAYVWPTDRRPVLEQIHKGSLKGLNAWGGILGLVQIFVQWACSVTVLSVFALKPQVDRPANKTAAFIACLHALAILAPIIATTFPSAAKHSWGTDVRGALIIVSNNVVAICCVVLQFYAQFMEMRAEKRISGALSLLSIGLQIMAFATLSFRWFLRLGPQTERNLLNPAWYLYQWAFPAVNYFIHALGCALLLTCYHFGRGTREQLTQGEETPLVG